MTMSSLQMLREQYQPSLPQILTQIPYVSFEQKGRGDVNPDVATFFPHLSGQSILVASPGNEKKNEVLRVGVVLSGGQASGGHNVIIGLYDALQVLNIQNRLFGFLNGPGGVVKGAYQELEASILQPYRNQGGFDLIGSGRTKIQTPEQLKLAMDVMLKMQLNALVVIGGDDSNTNAAMLAEYFLSQGCQTQVIGVPKTIDGDLQNERVQISFGFDTACKVYSEIIGNIARDALSAQKYYHFIRLMGRSASHIALECSLATSPNYTLIGEEILSCKHTLRQITCMLADLICQRAEADKHFGVILIPEGIIEFIPEVRTLIQELNAILAKDTTLEKGVLLNQLTQSSQECFLSLPKLIQEQLLLKRDPHGNVQVSMIETEKLLMDTVELELANRKERGGYLGEFHPVAHFLGYEGRAGFPSNFDCNYCYALGFTAALLAKEGCSGYMCFIDNLMDPVKEWRVGGIPLIDLMHLEMRGGQRKPVIKKALVDLNGQPFLRFQQDRDLWRINDHYHYPGPMQFSGDPLLIESFPRILTK